MIQKDDSKKNTTITFRVTEEMKKKIGLMAVKDNRSLSNYIIMLLEKSLKEKK